MDDLRKQRLGRNNPIIVLFIPRTGSSMVTGLFAQHGCWTGTTRKMYNLAPKGVYSNIIIGKYIKDTYGNRCQMVTEPLDGLRDAVDRAEPSPPWLFKCAVQYWRIWTYEGFEPQWILVRRNPDCIIKSVKKIGLKKELVTGYDCNKPYDEVIRERFSEMDYLRDKGGVDVFSEEIAKGNYSSLEKAFEVCGLTFDRKIADNFVEPDLWHFT